MKKFNILTMEGFLYSYAVISLISLCMFTFKIYDNLDTESFEQKKPSPGITAVALNRKIFNYEKLVLGKPEKEKPKVFAFHERMNQYAEKIIKSDYLIPPDLGYKMALSLTDRDYREWRLENELKFAEKKNKLLSIVIKIELMMTFVVLNQLKDSELLTLNISNFKKQEREVFELGNRIRTTASESQ